MHKRQSRFSSSSYLWIFFNHLYNYLAWIKTSFVFATFNKSKPNSPCIPIINSPCCCCGTGLDLPLFLEFMRYSTTLLYLDADAISREPSLDAINSRLEILDKDVPKPHFISLGVLQIVKTLGKIVQLSNFILLVYFLHITG